MQGLLPHLELGLELNGIQITFGFERLGIAIIAVLR